MILSFASIQASIIPKEMVKAVVMRHRLLLVMPEDCLQILYTLGVMMQHNELPILLILEDSLTAVIMTTKYSRGRASTKQYFIAAEKYDSIHVVCHTR
jgi:hypothetical protein